MAGDYKQRVASYFDQQHATYDQGSLHTQLAEHLVEYAHIQPHQRILDIATGTGLVALKAAEVCPDGSIVGIDISTRLLAVAERKRQERGYSHVHFQMMDAESLTFAPRSFDQILCCSALPYFTNIPQTLRHWRLALKPRGQLGLCVFSQTAFTLGNLLQQTAERYGIHLNFNQATGTVDMCYKLLAEAGYKTISIVEEQLGSYLTPSEIEYTTSHLLMTNPLCEPLSQLPPAQLTALHSEYSTCLKSNLTTAGLWNDMTTFFVMGQY